MLDTLDCLLASNVEARDELPKRKLVYRGGLVRSVVRHVASILSESREAKVSERRRERKERLHERRALARRTFLEVSSKVRGRLPEVRCYEARTVGPMLSESR